MEQKKKQVTKKNFEAAAVRDAKFCKRLKIKSNSNDKCHCSISTVLGDTPLQCERQLDVLRRVARRGSLHA